MMAQTNAWKTAAPLPDVRSNCTSTLLQNGNILTVGGVNNTPNNIQPDMLYNTLTNAWSTSSQMLAGRQRHGAVLLPNGKVLVVGGIDNTGTLLSSVELYSPKTDTWSSASALSSGLSDFTLTLLDNGLVLLAGGKDAFNNGTATSLLYDYVADTWTATGNNLSVSRLKHTATLIEGGKVIVVGGLLSVSGSTTNSAEIFNPNTNTWSTTSNLTTDRYAHVSSVLLDGKVMVVGGWSSTVGGNGLNTCEIYDPALGTWSAGANLPIGADFINGGLLPSGNVIIFGGHTNIAVANVYQYNQGLNSWAVLPSMNNARYSSNAVILPNGHIIMIGGGASGGKTNTVEIFDPAVGSWGATASLATARGFHQTITLQDGRILAIGGISVWANTATNTCEIYDPATGLWSATGSLNTGRYAHTATLLPSGKVLVTGGHATGAVGLNTCETYDPVAGTWSLVASMTNAKWEHSATLLFNGYVLVVASLTTQIYDPSTDTWFKEIPLDGGATFWANQAVLLPNKQVMLARQNQGVHLYNPCENKWTAATTLPVGAGNRNAIIHLLPDGENVLYAGGVVGASTGTQNTYLYNIATNTWTQVGNMTFPRYEHNSVIMPNGKIVTTGGYSGGYHPETDVFDPLTQTWDNIGNATLAIGDFGMNILPNSNVLKNGGLKSVSAATEILDIGTGENANPKPTISALNPSSISISTSSAGTTLLEITGTGFKDNNRLKTEASSGNTVRNSATNYPVVQLIRFGNSKTDNDYFIYPPFDVDNYVWDSTKTRVILDHTNLPAGNYAVRVSANGVSSDPAYFTVNFVCDINTNFLLDDTICLGTNIDFINLTSGQTPVSCWDWRFGDGDSAITRSPTHLYTDTGLYKIVLTGRSIEGCVDTVSKLLYIKPITTASTMTFDTTVCQNATVQYTVTSGDSYVWTPSTGLSNDTIQNPLITISAATSYTVLIYTNGVCLRDTAIINIGIFPQTNITLSTDKDAILLGESTQLHVTPSLSVYTWSPPGSLDNASNANPLASPIATTSYILSSLDSNGCAIEDSITVYVLPDKRLFLPNVFSPNNDGNNDEFRAISNAIDKFRIIIYDRWGAMVFESFDLNFIWDGTYSNGEKAGKAVYVYRIEGSYVDGEAILEKGNVTLIR